MKARHLLALAALLAACTNDAAPNPEQAHTVQTTQPDQRPAHRCTPISGDMTDPADVADAAAFALSCFDTAYDASPIEATRRAATYFQNLDHTPESIRTDPWWNDMAARGGFTQVDVERMYMETDLETPEEPTFTATRKSVAVPQSHDWVGSPRTTIYEFTLAQTGDDWQITTMQSQRE